MSEVTKEDFDQLERNVENVENLLKDVHTAIIGNPLSKDGGIAKRLFDAETELEQLKKDVQTTKEKQIKLNVYTVIMWTSLGGVGMAIFYMIINQLFKR